MTRYDMMMRGGFKSMEEFDEAQRREEERVQRRLSEENKRAFEQTTPNVEVQPVKHGKWLHFNSDGIIFCSECKHEAYWDTDYGQQLFDYCPYCGANMRGDI